MPATIAGLDRAPSACLPGTFYGSHGLQAFLQDSPHLLPGPTTQTLPMPSFTLPMCRTGLTLWGRTAHTRGATTCRVRCRILLAHALLPCLRLRAVRNLAHARCCGRSRNLLHQASSPASACWVLPVGSCLQDSWFLPLQGYESLYPSYLVYTL